ncbi:hypothetical protein PENSPDRAFT_640744 [Peniophora sp. CONT]|nr:hypothetical protein PENSPDRAFT_640744 [Peniophora sp. CONT]
MKLVAVFATLFAGAYAQGINIGSPQEGSTITTGDQTVQVRRPSTLTNSAEVAIVISIEACNADGTCLDDTESLGATLYNGPYHPQRQSGNNEPYQNFTVSIPDSLAGQKALLSVVHLSLADSGPFPLFQIVNATVHVDAN